MNRRLPGHPTVAAALVVVTVLVASSCIWSGPFGDSRSLRYQPNADITVADVAGLVTDWTATIDSTPQTPVIDGDMAVVASGTKLRGFSAQGCAATTCAPVWEASDTNHFGQPMIHDGIVYVNVHGVLHAYDADGSSGCTGSPLVCTPLWTAPGDTYVTIGDGVVVVSGGWYAAVYEAGDGTAGSCGGSPKSCQPLRYLDVGCSGIDPDVLGTTCASGPASIGDGIIAIGSTINERIESPVDPDSFSHSGGLATFAVDPDCVSQPPTPVPGVPAPHPALARVGVDGASDPRRPGHVPRQPLLPRRRVRRDVLQFRRRHARPGHGHVPALGPQLRDRSVCGRGGGPLR